MLVSVVFLLIAIAHLLRIIFRTPAVVGGWAVPFWVNWVALLFTAFLAYQGFQISRKTP
jgi:hypothetical protein